jgi:NADPH:quinone reductase-like Zn-dependent oxidoreductase
MKAARIHQFGGSDTVAIEEVEVPKLKPKHALVRVVAAGVNPVDWMVREHSYNPRGADRVPMTLGQDFAGIIERVAPGSRSQFREGDEVFGEAWGTFAEEVSVPVKDLVRKPAGIDFVTAAALPMPGLTAWQIVRTARVSKRKRVLVHGAGGPVGSLVAQLAKRKGSYVIATASRSNFRFLRRIRVDEVIDYEHGRFEEKVSDVDVVIEHLGGDVQKRSFRVLKPGGMLINLMGEIDRPAARKARVRGVLFGMKYDTRDLARLAALAADGTIDPHVSKVLSLDEVRMGLDMNQRGRSHGKVVLRVG